MLPDQTAVVIPNPTSMSRAWLVVGLLCVVGCLNYLDRIMITTMRVSIIEAIPMTDAQFGLLTAVFLWIYGLLSPFAGFLADRFSRSRVIIGSLFVWSAVTWLTAHATTYNELLATRALMGISEACYIPAALSLIVDYHRGNGYSHEWHHDWAESGVYGRVHGRSVRLEQCIPAVWDNRYYLRGSPVLCAERCSFVPKQHRNNRTTRKGKFDDGCSEFV